MTANLKSGKSKSCGCLQKEAGRKNFKRNFKYVDGTYLNTVLSKKLSKRNKTGVKGVYYSKSRKKYVATLTFRGKKHYLGIYDTLKEAAYKRKQAEEERDAYISEHLLVK